MPLEVVLAGLAEVAPAPERRRLVRDVGSRGEEMAFKTPYRAGGEFTASRVATSVQALRVLGVEMFAELFIVPEELATLDASFRRQLRDVDPSC
jgi:hypothetical protein